MIARDVEIVDLNPGSWRNLLSLFDVARLADRRPARPNLLSVLHSGGKVLRIYAPEGYRVPTLEQIDDPQALAKKLYYQLPGLDSVQILEQRSLGQYSDQVQRIDWAAQDADDFLMRAYRLAEQDPAGLCFYPTFSWSWNGLPLDGIRTWLAGATGPSVYFLGVIRDSTPWLTLILRVSDGKVRLITSVDYLRRFDLPVERLPASIQDLNVIVECLAVNLAPVRAALICDYFTFAKLLASEDKQRDLATAVAEGSAAHVGLLEG